MTEYRIRGPAPIIRAALASLEAAYPAHVASFNADVENTVELETPRRYVFGADNVMDAYPIVEAFVLDGTFGPFSTGESGVGDADHTPRLQVVVWVEGETGEVPELYEKGIGYAMAAIEILTVDGALGPEAEVSGTRDDAVTYAVRGPIGSEPDDETRSFRRWRVPVVCSFVVEAVDHWAPA